MGIKSQSQTDKYSTTTSFGPKTLQVQLTSLMMQKVTQSRETPTDLPEKVITFRYDVVSDSVHKAGPLC